MTQQTERNSKKKGTNWLGWVIFLVLFVGPNIIPPIIRFISNITGGTIHPSSSLVMAILIGTIIVVAILVSAVKKLGNSTTMQLPTSLPTSTTSQSPSRTSSATPNQSKKTVGDLGIDDFQSMLDAIDLLGQTQAPPAQTAKDPVKTSTLSATKGTPKTPSFEPIVSGKVLALGILMMMIFGGFVALARSISHLFP